MDGRARQFLWISISIYDFASHDHKIKIIKEKRLRASLRVYQLLAFCLVCTPSQRMHSAPPPETKQRFQCELRVASHNTSPLRSTSHWVKKKDKTHTVVETLYSALLWARFKASWASKAASCHSFLMYAHDEGRLVPQLQQAAWRQRPERPQPSIWSWAELNFSYQSSSRRLKEITKVIIFLPH